MATWWRKRQTPDVKGNKLEPTEPATAETDVAEEPDERAGRGAQPAQIPTPRSAYDGGADNAERWDMIKRDLIALDPEFFKGLEGLAAEAPAGVDRDVSDERLANALRRLSIRFLVDEAGALLAMWERHVLQIRREGPNGEILVLRARAYSTVPTDWSDRAYSAANEWNRTRRFLKAYVGAPTESQRLPLFGETQIPLRPGLSDELLDEFIDCAAAVSGAYVDWLHGDGAVL